MGASYTTLILRCTTDSYRAFLRKARSHRPIGTAGLEQHSVSPSMGLHLSRGRSCMGVTLAHGAAPGKPQRTSAIQACPSQLPCQPCHFQNATSARWRANCPGACRSASCACVSCAAWQVCWHELRKRSRRVAVGHHVGSVQGAIQYRQTQGRKLQSSSNFGQFDRFCRCRFTLESLGWHIAQFGVRPDAVVKANDVVSDTVGRQRMIGIVFLPNPIDFQIQEETLHDGVTPAAGFL